jgi:peroxiredoxin
MYPHERSLVRKMEGQPFALLGINTDPRDRAKSTIKRENINWRNWWDGGNTSGPIARAWNIKGWPTLVLIDHEGVIREKFLGVQELGNLEEAIARLVAKAAAAK